MQDDVKMPRCWNYNQVGNSEKIDSQLQQQIRSLRVGLALSPGCYCPGAPAYLFSTGPGGVQSDLSNLDSGGFLFKVNKTVQCLSKLLLFHSFSLHYLETPIICSSSRAAVKHERWTPPISNLASLLNMSGEDLAS